RGMFEHVEGIESCVRELLGVDRVVVRADKKVEEIEGFRAFDRRAADVECEIFEHDLRFRVQCSRGHKTGFFVDQREARREVAQLARGRHVLDLCCYTGGCSLAAARGGAKSVRGVDLDEEAIAVARENGRLNSLDVSFEHADAFDTLRAGARADLIVLDPPKLASSPRELGRARAKSIDFNALALEALQPGGLLLTFSCTGLFSSEDFLHHLREASVRAGRPARVLRVTGQPPDHPVHLDCPEGRYLTGVLLEVP
ncbi:MAG: class I SAM-dependent methyltransferase, partial [Planctomycetota bacterium]|nr:class I SAM-dependent methyltransferase [Planctomycetota bacterium]